jgi:peroxidase
LAYTFFNHPKPFIMLLKKSFFAATGVITLALVCNTAQAQLTRAQKAGILTETPVASTTTPAQPGAVTNAAALVAPTTYRTITGINNNTTPGQEGYGSANRALFRELPAVYGSTDPANAMGGATRPSARAISNSLCDEPVTIFNARGLSAFVYIWGQFIDHDMTLVPTGTESVPIPLPVGETVFTVNIPFKRSAIVPRSSTTVPRQQVNMNTSWLDASMVYGSDNSRASWLRTFQNGKLKTSTGNFMPYNTTTGELGAPISPNAPRMDNDNNLTVKTFVAGDIRAAEHPGLISMHTLFLREHNRICNELFALGFRNDEEMYQKARKRVGALIQAITYQEFLPAMGVTLLPYFGYNSSVVPDIRNTFAAAGYRLGHTMVADEVLFVNNACTEVIPPVELFDAFFNPALFAQYGTDPILKGLSTHNQYETNTKINSILRNFLFGVGSGIDLASLNIQRGRDHGLPNYNAIRAYYTGLPAFTFSQITSNDTVRNKLIQLYNGNINNIDPWIGILSENLLSGTSVGITVHEILRSQFEKLRDGDYYFYQRDPFLSLIDKLQIINTTLSTLIKRNTSLTSLQSNVFFKIDCPAVPPAVAARNAIKVVEATNHVKAFPNPASKVLNINLGDATTSVNVKIFTIAGVLVKTINTVPGNSNVSINISSLSKGTYFVQVENGKETKLQQFVKL